MKFSIIRQLIVVALTICCLKSNAASKVLIKVNVLRGERFVTVRTNQKEIEDKVAEVFSKKGFEILTKLDATAGILFVDFFVYQFPSQYPAISITIRTQYGIHYFDQEYKKMYVDRELTNVALAAELAERVPAEVSTAKTYRLNIAQLIATNKASNTHVENSSYYSTIKWKDDNQVPFIIPNDLNLYVFYASNFTGLKKQLSRGPIVLKLKINETARFELIEIKSQASVDEELRSRIQGFIDSFPLWMTNSEVENIEIVYGLR
jgi:hypothetical protein